MNYGPELDFTLDALRMASEITEGIRSSVLSHQKGTQISKQDDGDDPVTLGDLGAQAVFLFHLKKQFPQDGVMAEETSQSLAQLGAAPKRNLLRRVAEVLGSEVLSERELAELIDWRGLPGQDRVWMIDPIDGTKGYRDGYSYVSAAGLCDRGEPVLGAMASPSLKIEGEPMDEPTLYWAVRDEGAWSEALIRVPRQEGAKRLRVKPTLSKEDIRAVGSRANYEDKGPKAVLKMLGVAEDRFLVCDSQVKYAIVASGRAAMYLRPPHGSGSREKPWDHCAGVVIAGEAGAVISDMDGRPLDFMEAINGSGTMDQNRGLLVTSGVDHEEIIALCKAAKT